MPKVNIKTKWFHYNQNNSGGRHTEPAIHVLVEGQNAEDADRRAEELGLYFDGAGDCPCCGSRWSGAWDGEEEPSVYGVPLKEWLEDKDNFSRGWATREGIKLCLTYAYDGTKTFYD